LPDVLAARTHYRLDELPIGILVPARHELAERLRAI